MTSFRYSILIIFFVCFLSAQYSEEWSLIQDNDEWGFLYFDLNGDNVPELTKFWWNTVTVFDGANDYEVLWYLFDEEFEYFALQEVFDFDNNGDKEAIFISNNVIEEITTRITMYPVLESVPVWTSPVYNGTISWIESADLDKDSQQELVFGINEYDWSDSTYSSRLYVFNGLTGSIEWQSDIFSGYIVGPFLGDLDGDNTVEILFNFYDFENDIYLIRVYSFEGFTKIEENPDFSQTVSINPNYPNPFNSNTVIPISLNQESHIKISVFNTSGYEVVQIMNGTLAPGRYQFSWNGRDRNGEKMSSGIYFYNIEVGDNKFSRSMVLLK